MTTALIIIALLVLFYFLVVVPGRKAKDRNDRIMNREYEKHISPKP